MPPRPFAVILVRGLPVPDLRQTLEALVLREDYLPFDEGLVPKGYPSLVGEFDRWLVVGPDETGEVVLVPSAWGRVFHRVLDLSRLRPVPLWVAVRQPPGGSLCLKVWQGGEMRLKLGPDPDDEVFYSPLQATEPQIADFWARWTGVSSPLGPLPRDPEALVLELGIPANRPSFSDLWREPDRLGRTPWQRWTFLSRRSRLAQEFL